MFLFIILCLMIKCLSYFRGYRERKLTCFRFPDIENVSLNRRLFHYISLSISLSTTNTINPKTLIQEQKNLVDSSLLHVNNNGTRTLNHWYSSIFITKLCTLKKDQPEKYISFLRKLFEKAKERKKKTAVMLEKKHK